jgi:hypothetical protein
LGATIAAICAAANSAAPIMNVRMTVSFPRDWSRAHARCDGARRNGSQR